MNLSLRNRTCWGNLRQRWWVPILTISLISHLLIVAKALTGPSRPPMTPDTAIFEYAGWSLIRGVDLYQEFWEVKLPLPYQTTAVFAWMSGGNVLVGHLLAVGATVLASIVSALTIGALAREITDNDSAAVISGLGVFILPGFVYLPALGFKSKYYVLLAGFAAIWLARRNRFVLAGGAAVASVGYYHLAIIFPIIAVGLALQHGGTRDAARTIIGGVGVTIAMVLPIFLSGDIGAMIAESIVIPLLVGEPGQPVLHRILRGGWYFEIGVIGALIGIFGVGCLLTEFDIRETWWIGAGTGWFSVTTLFLDFDHYPDLILPAAFIAIGIGGMVATFSRHGKGNLITGLAATLVLINLMSVIAIGGLTGAYTFDDRQSMDQLQSIPYTIDNTTVARPDVRYLYWNGIESETCHIRLSRTELDWLALSKSPLLDRNCGELGSALEHHATGR